MASTQKARGAAFGALSERVRGWIEKKKWAELRPIQKKVIPVLLHELRKPSGADFVISAPTASGKTEAVFLPIATILDGEPEPQPGADVLYICPLIALIDQQAERLRDGIIDHKRYAVTPWHGRAGASGKVRFQTNPGGILVITPESLESMFINRSEQLTEFFGRLRCVVIDEFHAFFNNPRGVQLVSQLNRIDMIAGRKVPRLALSATFNRESENPISDHLRPGNPDAVRFLRDEHAQHELAFTIRSYADPTDPPEMATDRRSEEIARAAYADFRNLHATGTKDEKAKGLIFVNSRKEAEFFSLRLSELAGADGEDVQFFPHHGSLAPNERSDAEKAIRDPKRAAVIVCTSTLELGIDIGMITQVGQVDPGSSVSALHQRLGRSGRRHGQISRLIMYVRDAQVRGPGSPLTELHLPTFRALAQISLVQDKAYEPPDRRSANLSTLIQQILSLAAQQRGAVTIDQVRQELVEGGPFYALRGDVDRDNDHLALLFARLEVCDLLERSSESEYGLTVRARRMMDDHHFFAAFQGGDDYRVQAADGGLLGTVPSAHLYAVGDRIIYARRTWTIVSISREIKVIRVAPAPSGEAPLFSGDPIPPSQAVLSRMKALYDGTVVPRDVQLDPDAARLFAEGLQAYERLELSKRSMMTFGKGVLLLPWLAYRGQMSLVAALRFWGANASPSSVAVFIEAMSLVSVEALLRDLAAGKKTLPPGSEAMRSATSVLIDKHDGLLSPYLQRWNAATSRLDMDCVRESARALLQVSEASPSQTRRRRPLRRSRPTPRMSR